MSGLAAIGLGSALVAKHAQHVVLIHFPIAQFIAGVAFDLVGQWKRRRALADAAYYSLLVAAWSTIPALVTGLLAWQLQLEGQRLKGVLLLHLTLAFATTAIVWFVWRLHRRARLRGEAPPRWRAAVELLGVGVLALTGHLGGILSGVNAPG